MSSEEIRQYPLGSLTAGYFARAYADENTAKRARQRAAEDIRSRDDTSVFRVVRPDGQHLLIVVSQTVENATRVRQRVSWGGESCVLADDEIDAVMARFVEVAEAGQLRSRIDWSGVGGLGVNPGGSLGPLRRRQG